jgi:hypothetical protein
VRVMLRCETQHCPTRLPPAQLARISGSMVMQVSRRRLEISAGCHGLRMVTGMVVSPAISAHPDDDSFSAHGDDSGDGGSGADTASTCEKRVSIP